MRNVIRLLPWACLLFAFGTTSINFYGPVLHTAAHAQTRATGLTASGNLVTSVTGLAANEISEAFAVEQAPHVVPVGYEINVPVVVDPALYYLLILDTVSGQWNRYFFSQSQWRGTIEPALSASGVDVVRQPRGTADSTTAANEVTQVAPQSYFGGAQIANVVLYGSPNGPAGAPLAPPAVHVEPTPPLSSTVAGDQIGAIAAQFRVDESGAATYSVPIATSAGTAGVAPQVSLNYSSSGGNDIAGYGWSLSATSQISRCRKTLGTDQQVSPILWSTDDALCLDGQRLLLTSGTQGVVNSTYRTEVDSGAIVTLLTASSGDPTGFKVERKDGSTSYYGRVSGSSETDAILARFATASAATKDEIRKASTSKAASAGNLSWSLKKYEDNVGNFIWFKYQTDTQQQVLTEIRYAYGANTNVNSGYGARLVFDYATTPRDDKQGGYLGGHRFVKDKLLTRIVSYNRYRPGSSNTETEAVLREYKLNYQAESVVPGDKIKRLASIEECVGTVCLPATTFDWRVPESAAAVLSLGSFTMANRNHKVLSYQIGDIDGDGKTDFAWVEGSFGSNPSTMQPRLNYALSSGNTYAQKRFTNNSFEIIFPHVSSSTDISLALVDYNLDGRSDLFYFDHGSSRWRVYLSKPQPDGTWQLSHSPVVTDLQHDNATFADINGDGATDVIYKTTTGISAGQVRVRKLVRNSQPDSSATAYSFGPEISVVREGGATSFSGEIQTTSADFNGDGRTDIFFAGFFYFEEPCFGGDVICRVPTITERTTDAYVFTGDPNASPLTVERYANFDNDVSSSRYIMPKRMQFTDVNADGLTDVFYQVAEIDSNNALQNIIRINRGDGTFSSMQVSESTLGDNASSESGSVDQPQWLDWNMDGYPDLVWKSLSNGQSYIRYWQPETDTYGTRQSFGSSTNDDRVSVFYPDVNGDGVLDRVILDNRNNVGRVTSYSRQTFTLLDDINFDDFGDPGPIYIPNDIANRGVNRIDTITNGLGMVTKIDYQALTASNHYSRLAINNTLVDGEVCIDEPELPGGEICFDQQVQAADTASFYSRLNGDWDLPPGTDTLGKTTPVLEINTPMYVVTSVESDAPAAGTAPRQVDQSARTKLSYFYAQANVQAAGRGFLGFRKLITRDEQTGVTTTSTYRQDWPFMGYPLTTRTETTSGHLLSESMSEWGFLENSRSARSVVRTVGTQALGPMHPVVRRSVESRYDLKANGAQAGARLSTIATDTTFDVEANPVTISATHYDGSDNVIKSVATTNTYHNTSALPLHHSRLASTTVTTSRQGYSADKTRYSEFRYFTSGPKQGLLRQELIEPGSVFETISTHDYDAFGNKIKSSTTGGGETRCDVVTSVFDSRGRYQDKTYDCMGRLLTEVRERHVTGGPTKARAYFDANHYVEMITAYTTLGRTYFERDAFGAFSESVVTSDLSFCPVGTVFKKSMRSAGGGQSADCIDKLGRVIRAMSKGFDGAWNATDTEYDNLNRTKRQSEPFDLPGNPTLWTTNSYDIGGRPTAVSLPDGSATTIAYNGLSKTVTNDQGQENTEVANALGERIRVVDNIGGVTRYEYNHFGSLTKIIDNAGNTLHTEYDLLGRKIWTIDPDKGTWTYDYNAFGEMTLQVDAIGQRTELTYDSLGRPLTRHDYEAPAGGGSGNGPLAGNTIWEYDTAPNGLGELTSIRDTVTGYRQDFTFDVLGRASESVTQIDGKSYFSKVTYDQFGRIYQNFDTAGDGTYQDFGTVNLYNAHGYLETIADAVYVSGQPREIYRKTLEMNARGQVVREEFGNGVVTTTGYDAQTGDVVGIFSAGAVGEVQDLRYDWDTVGNLEYRHEYSGSKTLQESFQYDALNRLTRQTVSGQSAIVVTYDDAQNQKLGNIGSKTGVGTYQYGQNGAGPHAVSRAGSVNYFYDANGNNTSSSDGRIIDYTVFNKIRSASKNGHTTEFWYAPDRSRYKRVDDSGAGITTTRYVGNTEFIERPDGTFEKKRYIEGGVIQTVFHGTDAVEDYRENLYAFRDHLGSLDVVADDRGAIVQEFSFDAWGKRRNASNWQTLSAGQIAIFDSNVTRLGFTGHEMMDEVGIIHMNGRIYDPHLGRFLQGDPLIPSMHLTQSTNRYSYVMNNPLNATDPSGYFPAILGWAIAGFLAGAAAQALDLPVLSAIANIAVCVTAGPMCAAAFSFSSTLGAGGSFASALKSGLFAGVSAAAFGAIGKKFTTEATGFFKAGSIGHIGAHAITGGILSVAQGGKFGHGFLTAGLTKALDINSLIPGIEERYDLVRAVTAALVGGTISALSGGKFVNGALTAGFAQAYNGNSFWRKARDYGALMKDLVQTYGLEVVRSLIPGIALYDCATKGGCSFWQWAGAVGEVAVAVAGGAVLSTAYNLFKKYGSLRRAINAGENVCGCCFAAGTTVATDAGPVPIDELRPGDHVYARNMETGAVESQPVTNAFAYQGREIHYLTTRSGAGDFETVAVSDNHPFWVDGTGWVDSGDLEPGMLLRDANGQEVFVVSVEAQGFSETTFNIEVDEHHNFFVGDQQVLTHNMCSCALGGKRPSGGSPALRGDDYNPDVVEARIKASRAANRNRIIHGEADALGFGQRIAPQRAHFNSHGQDVFTDGRNFITRDVDSHSGGVWKMFNRRGDRLGTYDANLSRIGD